MRIWYGPVKNERNIRERGLPFDWAADFAFDTASYAVDDRQAYGETRYVAIGLLAERLHVLCFAETVDGIRVISFRKANVREVKRHAQVKAAG
ncbi:MAG: BrnT family toxin [Burkholderiales bacterium]|nr:BrnT family toxin [Burkholderiales bacterium]MDE2455502.1 BrnT family toxin [Burkholderiales bacterium]